MLIHFLPNCVKLQPVGNFNKGNRGGGARFFGRDGFGRKNFDGGQGRGGDRQMVKAGCSNCGRDCEVPFRPTGEKPVYCSECFEKMGGGSRSDRQGDRPRFADRRPQSGGGSDQYKGQFENLNIKLDKILRLLEPKTVVAQPAKPTEPVKETVEPAKEVPETVKEVKKAEKEVKEVVVMETSKVKKVSKKKTPAEKK